MTNSTAQHSTAQHSTAQHSTAQHSTAQHSNNKNFLLLALLFLIPALPLVFLGYGSDNDIYGELDAGVKTWLEGIPTMSRHPGYWLHEAMVFILDNYGGFLLINIATLLASLVVVYRVWHIACEIGIKWRFPILLCLVWNPWYLIASTSGIDYIWGILFIILSVEAFILKKGLSASIFGGVAVGFRLGSIFPITGAFIFMSLKKISFLKIRWLFFILMITSLLGILFYIPSWFVSEGSLKFLIGHLGDKELWTLKMHIGRAIYKPIYLMGLMTTLSLFLILILNRNRAKSIITKDRREFVLASIGIVLGTILLYFKYPIEHSYLLPGLPFLLLLVGVILDESPKWQPYLLLISTLSFWVVSFPIAVPNVPHSASDATIGLYIEQGPLVADIKKRITLIGCHNLKCYGAKLGSPNQ